MKAQLAGSTPCLDRQKWNPGDSMGMTSLLQDAFTSFNQISTIIIYVLYDHRECSLLYICSYLYIHLS